MNEETSHRCKKCRTDFMTTVHGNTTRCPGCGSAQYIPRAPGADISRPTVELTCSKCAHVWPSTAAAGSTVRCPECHHAKRVPTAGARTVAAPSSVPAERPSVPVRPMPTPVRAAFVSAPPPAAPVRVEPPEPPVIAPAAPRTEQTRPPMLAGWPGLAEAMSAVFGMGGASRLPPADAVTVFDRIAVNGVESRPARARGPLPVDTAAVDRALASLMLTRGPDWPAGSCPLGSCGELVDVRVVWGPDARLDVCDRHASRITAAAIRLARPAPTLTAVPPVR